MARLVPPRATVKLAAAYRRPRRAFGRLALVAPVVLAMLAISGCGGSGGPSGHARATLHAASEHQLLALLSRARTEVAAHSRVGVDAALARFIDDVHSLRGSRELTASTAAALDRQALATETQAARQLPPSNQPVQTTTTVLTTPQPLPPKPHPGKGGPGGPPGQANGKPPKGGHGPGGGQQSGDGNGGGPGGGDS